MFISLAIQIVCKMLNILVESSVKFFADGEASFL